MYYYQTELKSWKKREPKLPLWLRVCVWLPQCLTWHALRVRMSNRYCIGAEEHREWRDEKPVPFTTKYRK